MRPEDGELWERIRDFEIGPTGTALGFADRLARENGWSRAHADRVIEEYKRFVFLAATADRCLTPSDAVDQAWHLHLVYTESYWHELCREILARPLHHGPTRGGRAEARKYRGAYERTLDRYAETFGPPPRSIWPDPAARFAGAERFRRVDTARHWVVARPDLRRGGSLALGAATALAALGCGALIGRGQSPLESIGDVVLIGGFVWLIFWIGRNAGGSGRGGGGSCGGTGCGGCGGGGCGS